VKVITSLCTVCDTCAHKWYQNCEKHCVVRAFIDYVQIDMWTNREMSILLRASLHLESKTMFSTRASHIFISNHIKKRQIS
jgi:hypothetical protein